MAGRGTVNGPGQVGAQAATPTLDWEAAMPTGAVQTALGPDRVLPALATAGVAKEHLDTMPRSTVLRWLRGTR